MQRNTAVTVPFRTALCSGAQSSQAQSAHARSISTRTLNQHTHAQSAHARPISTPITSPHFATTHYLAMTKYKFCSQPSKQVLFLHMEDKHLTVFSCLSWTVWKLTDICVFVIVRYVMVSGNDILVRPNCIFKF